MAMYETPSRDVPGGLFLLERKMRIRPRHFQVPGKAAAAGRKRARKLSRARRVEIAMMGVAERQRRRRESLDHIEVDTENPHRLVVTKAGGA